MDNLLILCAGTVLTITLATMAIFGFLIIGTAIDSKQEKRELQQKAADGLIILLTVDQYLALNQADPEKYPLKIDGLYLQFTGNSPLRMLSEDYDKLRDIAYKQEQAVEQKKRREICMEELHAMQSTLSDYIEKQEKKNKKTAITLTEQAVQAVRAEGKTLRENPLLNKIESSGD